MPLAVGRILILSPLLLAEERRCHQNQGLQSACFGFVLVLGLGSGNSSYRCGYIRCPLLCHSSHLGVTPLSSPVTPCKTSRVASCASWQEQEETGLYHLVQTRSSGEAIAEVMALHRVKAEFSKGTEWTNPKSEQ